MYEDYLLRGICIPQVNGVVFIAHNNALHIVAEMASVCLRCTHQ